MQAATPLDSTQALEQIVQMEHPCFDVALGVCTTAIGVGLFGTAVMVLNSLPYYGEGLVDGLKTVYSGTAIPGGPIVAFFGLHYIAEHMPWKKEKGSKVFYILSDRTLSDKPSLADRVRQRITTVTPVDDLETLTRLGYVFMNNVGIDSAQVVSPQWADARSARLLTGRLDGLFFKELGTEFSIVEMSARLNGRSFKLVHLAFGSEHKKELVGYGGKNISVLGMVREDGFAGGNLLVEGVRYGGAYISEGQ